MFTVIIKTRQSLCSQPMLAMLRRVDGLMSCLKVANTLETDFLGRFRVSKVPLAQSIFMRADSELIANTNKAILERFS